MLESVSSAALMPFTFSKARVPFALAALVPSSVALTFDKALVPFALAVLVPSSVALTFASHLHCSHHSCSTRCSASSRDSDMPLLIAYLANRLNTTPAQLGEMVAQGSGPALERQLEQIVAALHVDRYVAKTNHLLPTWRGPMSCVCSRVPDVGRPCPRLLVWPWLGDEAARIFRWCRCSTTDTSPRAETSWRTDGPKGRTSVGLRAPPSPSRHGSGRRGFTGGRVWSAPPPAVLAPPPPLAALAPPPPVALVPPTIAAPELPPPTPPADQTAPPPVGPSSTENGPPGSVAPVFNERDIESGNAEAAILPAGTACWQRVMREAPDDIQSFPVRMAVSKQPGGSEERVISVLVPARYTLHIRDGRVFVTYLLVLCVLLLFGVGKVAASSPVLGTEENAAVWSILGSPSFLRKVTAPTGEFRGRSKTSRRRQVGARQVGADLSRTVRGGVSPTPATKGHAVGHVTAAIGRDCDEIDVMKLEDGM